MKLKKKYFVYTQMHNVDVGELEDVTIENHIATFNTLGEVENFFNDYIKAEFSTDCLIVRPTYVYEF